MGVWRVSGGCLDGVYRMSKLCLGGVLVVSERKVRTCQVRTRQVGKDNLGQTK